MTPQAEIRFPSDFRVENLDRIHRLYDILLTELKTLGENRKAVLDLSIVRRFTPFSGCYLASMITELLEIVPTVTLRPPKLAGANHQIEHLGILSHFLDKRSTGSKRVRAVPLVHIKERDDDLAPRMARLTTESLSLSREHHYLINLCLKELLQNAFEHGRSEKGTFACAYGISNRRVVRICTMDHGIGVLSHLRRNPQFANVVSHKDALFAAIQKGVSGEVKRHRGLGLYYITKLLGAAGGEVIIASGDSLMHVGIRETTRFYQLDVPYSGTIVNVTFSARPDYRFTLDDLEDK